MSRRPRPTPPPGPGLALGRRTLVHGAVAAATVGLLGRRAASESPVPLGVGPAPRQAMAQAAAAFLATLDAPARRRAAWPFADAERRNWHYVPRGREGLAFKDMAAPAQAAAHALMQASLSATGYAKAVNVVRLEEVLRQIEALGFFRDPGKYHVSVFGAPGPDAPWGWRLEGHHLSLNFTLIPGRPVAVTPAFVGANPARVAAGPLAGLRTLGEEQDLGVALARSVGPALRARLVIEARSPGDIVSGPGRDDALRTPAGVALADLGPESRALALRLVETYARTMRGELAEQELDRMRRAGVERLHVAWAGPIDPARPHYYRLHGPTLLIEYDNTQNDANHVHTVWRDPAGDFGGDPLRSHYRHGHRHA